MKNVQGPDYLKGTARALLVPSRFSKVWSSSVFAKAGNSLFRL
ncbi:unnamed protein product [Musa acuminata subsp. burmannicoides]